MSAPDSARTTTIPRSPLLQALGEVARIQGFELVLTPGRGDTARFIDEVARASHVGYRKVELEDD